MTDVTTIEPIPGVHPDGSPVPDRDALRAALDAAAERGAKATFDALYGAGRGLWADDAEFDQFLAGVEATRHEKG